MFPPFNCSVVPHRPLTIDISTQIEPLEPSNPTLPLQEAHLSGQISIMRLSPSARNRLIAVWRAVKNFPSFVLWCICELPSFVWWCICELVSFVWKCIVAFFKEGIPATFISIRVVFSDWWYKGMLFAYIMITVLGCLFVHFFAPADNDLGLGHGSPKFYSAKAHVIATLLPFHIAPFVYTANNHPTLYYMNTVAHHLGHFRGPRMLHRDLMIVTYLKVLTEFSRLIILLTVNGIRFADLLLSLHTAVFFIYFMRWSCCRFSNIRWRSRESVYLAIDIMIFATGAMVPTGRFTPLSKGETTATYQSSMGMEFLLLALTLVFYIQISYGSMRLFGGGFNRVLRPSSCLPTYTITGRFNESTLFRALFCRVLHFVVVWSLPYHLVYIVIHCLVFKVFFVCTPFQMSASSFYPASTSGFPSYVTCAHRGSPEGEVGQAYYYAIQLSLMLETPYLSLVSIAMVYALRESAYSFEPDMIDEYDEDGIQGNLQAMDNMGIRRDVEDGPYQVAAWGQAGVPLDRNRDIPSRRQWYWRLDYYRPILSRDPLGIVRGE